MHGVGGKPVAIDAATRDKIIVLYRDYLLTLTDLKQRFHALQVPAIRQTLVDAGIEIRGKKPSRRVA